MSAEVGGDRPVTVIGDAIEERIPWWSSRACSAGFTSDACADCWPNCSGAGAAGLEASLVWFGIHADRTTSTAWPTSSESDPCSKRFTDSISSSSR